MKKCSLVTLALFPNMRGFGFACLENPQKIIDNGMVRIYPLDNSKLLNRIQTLFDYFVPAVVVMREYSMENTRHSRRVRNLIDEVCKRAEKLNIRVYHYSREQVKDVFAQFEATTKYEIAQKIVEWFPQLAPRMPKIRNLWVPEDINMGTFDAIALAITHMYLTE